MEFTVTQIGKACVITPQGDIDALTAPLCAEAVDTQIGQGNYYLVLDLGQVDFVSSAGLRLLLSAAKSTRQNGGDLRLAEVRPTVEKMLKLSGFTNILRVFRSTSEAVDSYAT